MMLAPKPKPKPKPKRGAPKEGPVTVAMASRGVTVRLSAAAPAAEIVVGVRLAADGEHVLVSLSSRSARPAARALGTSVLTRREREVLKLLKRGRSHAEVAEALNVSIETARTHAKHIYDKLGVRSRKELLGLAP
jgi:DNA-binding CsgD family transcriptional regulator